MDKMYKVLKTVNTTSFSTFFTVDEILVETPAKNTATFFIRNAQDFSIIIPLLDENTCVMVEQHRVGADMLSLEFPMGIAHGHTPDETAIIELHEETGYIKPELLKIGEFYPSTGYSSQIAHVYIATNFKKGPQQLEVHEFVDIHEVSLPNLKEMVYNGKIIDGPTLAAYSKFMTYIGNNTVKMR
jgi:ADP-ribose pyrophosphatase